MGRGLGLEVHLSDTATPFKLQWLSLGGPSTYVLMHRHTYVLSSHTLHVASRPVVLRVIRLPSCAQHASARREWRRAARGCWLVSRFREYGALHRAVVMEPKAARFGQDLIGPQANRCQQKTSERLL